jgi:hypothetical protein
LSIALAFSVKMHRLLQKVLLVAGLFGTAAVSSPAQQTIVFSKPADMSADKANSFMVAPERAGNAKDFNAPRSLFKDYTPDNLGAPPVILNNQDPSVKEALEKRKNWTLLTPEQILGVQTPEQILGVAKPGDKKKLSLEEQYLQRENDTAVGAATNGRLGAAFWRGQANNPFEQRQEKDEYGNFLQSGQRSPTEARKNFSRTLSSVNALNMPIEKPDSIWSSVFAQPDQPKPDLDQIAAMERFRAMMEPSTPVNPTPTRFAVPATPERDPNLQVLPSFNPAGRAITPLASDIARPTGIMPLPGVGRPASTTPAKRPDWQAQLPPWLRSGPQTHTGNF